MFQRSMRGLVLAPMAALLLMMAGCMPGDPNDGPFADAGPDQTVAAGVTVTLDGSASRDPLSRPLTFAWSFVSTPDGSGAEIAGAESVAAAFVADAVGAYVVELVVTQGDATAVDTLTVTATSAGTGLLEPGGAVFHESGTIVAAQDDSFVGAVDITIREIDDPSIDVALPPGVSAVGPAYAFSATPALVAHPDHPFVIGFVVPEGVEIDGLAIALLERDVVYVDYAPPEDESASLEPSWVVLEGAFHPESNLLLAPVLAFEAHGWDAMLVRAEGFETTIIGEAPESQAELMTTTPTFEGRCGPGFGDAIETCTTLDLTTAAGMLGESYAGLTELGFTTTPRLMRAAGTWHLTFSPFRFRFVPGPYLIELRPSSAAIAGGMFSPSTGRIWIAIGTSGVAESSRRIVRHEYVHATQYGYDPSFTGTTWLASRWVMEGQAVLLESGYDPLARANRVVRDVGDTLERSRWTGSAWLAGPSSEYEAQDFWIYLASRFDHDDATFLRDFMARGQRASDVDAVLRTNYPTAFGGSGSLSGLPRAYWEWIKNHVFTKQVDMRSNRFGQTCAFTAGSATPTVLSYVEGTPPPFQTRTLEPLTSHVYRVDFSAPVHASYLASMGVTSASSFTQSIFYRDGQAGTTGCHGQADASSADLTVNGAQRYYVVVSNTSRTATVEHTLRFPGLRIATPAAFSTVDEGPINFRAVASGFNLGPSITWTRENVQGSTPFTFGTSVTGETITRTLCDGSYFVRAEARQGTTGPRVSQTVRITVRDLGATQLVPGCAPTVAILEPVAGGSYATGTPMILRADAVKKGDATYPIEWRTGSVGGPLIATGANTSHTFATAGSVTLFVVYGAASSQVSFNVVTGTPPSVTIVSPQDGATFAWFDHLEDQNGISVDFVALGTKGAGGALPASAYRWATRRSDLATWRDEGTGSSKEIFFPYSGSSVFQPWEVRVIVTDPDTGLTASRTITINIQRPPD